MQDTEEWEVAAEPEPSSSHQAHPIRLISSGSSRASCSSRSLHLRTDEDDALSRIWTLLAIATMSLPKSAWAQARERFLEDLEEPERLMFAEASLEHIFYGASAAQKTHQEGSRSRYLASKLDSLLTGIDQYGKAMDVLSQATSVLSLLWGSL